MDWTLENDVTLCEFNLECDAGEYAMYNLRGDLVAERSESLKVEFADQKLSFRQFSYHSLEIIDCSLSCANFRVRVNRRKIQSEGFRARI